VLTNQAPTTLAIVVVSDTATDSATVMAERLGFVILLFYFCMDALTRKNDRANKASSRRRPT